MLNLLNIVVAAILSLTGGAAHSFGSSITTILGTDQISASRAVINTNFANLNASKEEISDLIATTSLPGITSLPALTSAATLATVGTITSGTWTGTPVGVAYGGTGTTTPTSNQVMLGNGASGLKVVNGFGNSGQSLVSNGAATAPSWQSISFDSTANYSLTGTWTFNVAPTFGTFSATSTTGTSTIAAAITSNIASTSLLVVSKSCTGCDRQSNGVTSRAGDTASGSQTIAHGLARTPTYVRITAFKAVSNTVIARTDGTFSLSGTSELYTMISTTGSPSPTFGTDSNMVNIIDDPTNPKSQVATVAVDGTNITLTWTKNSTPNSNTIYIMWEAFY